MKKIIYLLTIVLLLQVNLFGYAKKIVFGSFKGEKNAKYLAKQVEKFVAKDKDLSKVLKSNNISVYVNKVGKLNQVSIRVFPNKTLLLNSIKIIRKKYKDAYIQSTTPLTKKAIKATKKQEIKKKIEPIVKTKPTIIIKKQEKEKEVISAIVLKNKKQTIVKKTTVKPAKKQEVKKIIKLEKNKEQNKTKKLSTNVEENTIMKSIHNILKNIDIKKYSQVFLDYLPPINFATILLFIVFIVLIYYGLKFKRLYDQY